MARARFNFQFDATKFKAKCMRLGRDYGDIGEGLLADQMRLWAIDALEHTYPKGIGREGQRKMQGVIDNQLKSIFQRITRGGLIEILKRRFGSGKWGKGQRNAAESAFGGRALFNVGGSQDEMRQWHTGKRDRDSGHIKVRPQQVGTMPTAGGKQFPIWNKMYVPMSAYAKFYKERAARVGILKGGWIPAIEVFSALARKPPTTRAIPAWVRKARTHDPVRSGLANAKGFNKSTLKGEMWMLHQVPWNDKLEGIVKRLGRTRQADLDKWAKIRLNQIARRFNKGETARIAA